MHEFKDSNGFSLIELMAALAIMGVVTMNVVAMMTNQASNVNKIKTSYTMGLVVNDIGQVLSNSTTCALNLPPAFLNTLSVGNTIAAPNNDFYRDVGIIIYSGSTDPTTGAKLGDGGAVINNFSVGDYDGNYTANFKINFFQKGGSITTRNVQLRLVKSGPTITGCNAVGFYDKTLPGTGITICPTNFTLIGSGRFAYCISSTPLGPATYSAAQSACLNNALIDPRLGMAHLCDFEEWSNACLSQPAALGITNTQTSNPLDATSWEWIAAAPTTSATTASSSLMTVIGGLVNPSASPCITVKTDVNSDGTVSPVNFTSGVAPKYRCCYH